LAARHWPSGTVVYNVTLATMTNEIHVDAMVDTGSTMCVIPQSIARWLGLHSGNRLRKRVVNVVGGQVEMDLHGLYSVQVGSAKAYNVLVGVHNTFPGTRMMLVGLTFMGKFTTTTFDFSEKRVLFRGGT
jgi:predicted aspartyl protease